MIRPRIAPVPRRLRRIAVTLTLITCALLAGLVAFGLTQANGAVGAALADRVRAVAGPAAAAEIERDYLLVRDDVQRLRYRLGLAQPTAPWSIPTPVSGASDPSHVQYPRSALVSSGTPVVAVSPTPTAKGGAFASAASSSTPVPTPQITPQPTASPPPPIAPLVSPALPGEGQWLTVATDRTAGQAPIVNKTFWRPDPLRPYALVTMLAFDLHAVSLKMVAGTQQPGGPLGHPGPGVIPTTDQQAGVLLAAFNGGFKLANGHFGMMVGGNVYVPLKDGVGSLALTRGGQVLIGVWGHDSTLSSANANLVAVRQNGPLLIDQGAIVPLTQNAAAWGQTVGGTHTWRSGIGLTADGRLLYASGNALSASTLADALKAAGAVRALELDINPFWVRAFTYSSASDGSLTATQLQPGMYGTGQEYLTGTARDFFYVVRRHP